MTRAQQNDLDTLETEDIVVMESSAPDILMIDIGAVVDCLAAAIHARRCAPASESLFEQTLTRLGLSHSERARMLRFDLRQVYNRQLFPVPLTLGAAVALRITDRSERLGLRDEEVLVNVERVGARILDLAPPGLRLHGSIPATRLATGTTG